MATTLHGRSNPHAPLRLLMHADRSRVIFLAHRETSHASPHPPQLITTPNSNQLIPTYRFGPVSTAPTNSPASAITSSASPNPSIQYTSGSRRNHVICRFA